ncbi:glutamine-dependent NAD(+) synthetase [Sugiyamaella lignohabitans]|uniref:Glutamine-dependent NAD(+) synthetase n=1 Tax=Sugiyamaella lignohabitans TaxID=796027 RepID=A0A161HMU7_9ASCO|nr:glutamine-dependent NAD(+) synthetase [Sugiyamaella lignohabitans]ANB15267.1 glutamine-dependent NAD(+) synthetase [Sugiyamaella lignohabitans]
MGHLVTVATCNLNQWALDFEGNRDRIIQSIRIAKERGASFRTGPELEITGYGCLDHFLEADTYMHSWEMYSQIITHPDCQDILLDIGMPIIHKSVRYNCRVISYNRKIFLIRPKLWLANDGNYREMRYFTPWYRQKHVEDHILPVMIQEVLDGKQRSVTFGDAKLDGLETSFGFETCEELFTPNSPHIGLALDGVEFFTNSSGSHHELRKLDTRMRLIVEATKKCGGVYLYANQRGCDGDRLYYDGCALIVVNGDVVAQGAQFGLDDVEVVTATVDLDSVRSYRSAPSFGMQSTAVEKSYPSVEFSSASGALSGRSLEFDMTVIPTKARPLRYHTPEEEIALGPACWLWDYLRRCRAGGFFIPLSGGIDSCATSVIVHSMCRLVAEAAKNGNEQVIADARRLAGKAVEENPEWVPTDPKEFANMIFHTCYMGTENSSNETRARAKALANDIGSYHVDMNIDTVVTAVRKLFETVTGKSPQYKVHGGSQPENLALQNIQARLRMVLAYLFALLLPWVRSRPTGGLLVLGSANVDEALRGYLTKYDCSSADINPIGGISKTDLKAFIAYARDAFDMPVLNDFLTATPTAELEPITKTYVQSDEADMGFTYDELSVFGRLRKVEKFGPYSAFIKLYHEWTPRLTPAEIAVKVKRFFYFYAINRHKMTVLTPSYHAEQYSPDDNRFDLRPFLILPSFPWASKKIDEVVKSFEAKNQSLQQDKQD